MKETIYTTDHHDHYYPADLHYPTNLHLCVAQYYGTVDHVLTTSSSISELQRWIQLR